MMRPGKWLNPAIIPTSAALLAMGSIQPAACFEPRPGGGDYFNAVGVALQTADLRFAEGGWLRGRDQGFAFALQRGSAEFFIWTRKTTRQKANGKPICWGRLLDAEGAEIGAPGPLAVATLAQGRKIYLVAATQQNKALAAWDITTCDGEQNLRAVARTELNDNGPKSDLLLVAGDFSGAGEDDVATVNPATAAFTRWRVDAGEFAVVKQGVIHAGPDVSATDIRFITQTRLPHAEANVAYEAAFLVLHARGYSLVDGDGAAISFSPSCVVAAENCLNKTLVFNLDQGLQGGLQDLMRRAPVEADKVLDRMIAALARAKTRFKVAALVSPIHARREATLRVLDRLAAANIGIVLDLYSSDIFNLAGKNKSWLNYPPRTADPGTGLSLNPLGAREDADSLDYFLARYGDGLVGVRIFERLGLTLQETLYEMRNDADRNAGAYFNEATAQSILAWAQANGKYVLWSDPHLYQPYECYLKGEEKARADEALQAYLDKERQLIQKFRVAIPIYNNNEGLKICGVAFSNAQMTPRNFRIVSWSAIPKAMAAAAGGGAAGFGLSVQSWSSDHDPVLNSVTLPPEEIVMWTLDGLRVGAAFIEFEPYNYFFAWPGARGVASTLEPGAKGQAGEALPTLELLFDYLGVGRAP